MPKKPSKQQNSLILLALVVGAPLLVIQKLTESGGWPYVVAIGGILGFTYVMYRIMHKRMTRPLPSAARQDRSQKTSTTSSPAPTRAPRPIKGEIKSQFICAVVGESFKNPDGTSRQAHIRQSVRPGMSATLVLEPENPHDPTAVAVIVAGRQVGYLKRDVAQRLSDNLEFDEFSAVAVVHGVHGGEGYKEHVGVTLEVSVYCDEGNSNGEAPQTPQQIRYELSQTHKDDLETMLDCCLQEEMDFLAAPEGERRLPPAIFFQRAAILQRKAKNYAAEVAICNRWTTIVSRYQSQQFVANGGGYRIDSDKTHINIVERVIKARSLMARSAKSS